MCEKSQHTLFKCADSSLQADLVRLLSLNCIVHLNQGSYIFSLGERFIVEVVKHFVYMIVVLKCCDNFILNLLEFFIRRETVTSASVSLHGLSAYANGETIQDLFSEIDKASEQIHAMEHLFFSIF